MTAPKVSEHTDLTRAGGVRLRPSSQAQAMVVREDESYRALKRSPPPPIGAGSAEGQGGSQSTIIRDLVKTCFKVSIPAIRMGDRKARISL